MTKIRTAEEILRDKGLVSKGCKQLIIRTESGEEHCVNAIMIEYAKQFIDAAVNESFQRCEDAIDNYVLDYFDSSSKQKEETINFEKSDTILKLKEIVV